MKTRCSKGAITNSNLVAPTVNPVPVRHELALKTAAFFDLVPKSSLPHIAAFRSILIGAGLYRDGIGLPVQIEHVSDPRIEGT